MKILKVHFKNLNSLEGEWSIDFSHPSYQSGGIFAITGPTGSGKTTLLDAICLALYGRTPRLKTISKSVNEVLTRKTGFCFSEVTFETMKGTFRCHWSQHRARKSPTGDLQQPRHEITDSSTSKILQNKIKEVARVVEEVTGMSFEEFTRSILLAQGNFAAFLQASPDERAPILEQITGTEIYSCISQKVHEQTAQEEGIYTLMNDELKSLHLDSEEEKQQLENNLSAEREHIDADMKNLAQLQEQIHWFQRTEKLKIEIVQLEDEVKDLHKEIGDASEKRKTLRKAQDASLLSPLYAQIVHIETQCKEDRLEITKIQKEQPTLMKKKEEIEERLASIETAINQRETLLTEEREVCKAVRALDITLRETHLQQHKAQENYTAVKLQHDQYHLRIEKIYKTTEEAQSQLHQCDSYLQEHSGDNNLIENFGRIEERAAQIKTIESKLIEINEKITSLKSVTASHETDLDQKQKCYALAETAYHQSKDQLNYIQSSIIEITNLRPSLRQDIESAIDRLQILEKINLILHEIEELREKEKVIGAAVDELQETMAAQKKQWGLLINRHTDQEKIVQQCETIAAQENRIRSLEDERRKLTEGVPCPLCGSTNHPFALELPEETDDAEAAVAREKEKLKRIQNDLSTLRVEEQLAAARSEELQNSRTETSAGRDGKRKQMARLCSQAGLNIKTATLPGLEDDIDEIGRELTELRQTAAKREELENGAISLQKQVENLRDEAERQQKEISLLQFDIDKTASLTSELASQHQELQQSRDDAQSLFNHDTKGYDVSCSANNVEQVLLALSNKFSRWKETFSQQQQLEKSITELQSELQHLTAVSEKLQTDRISAKHDMELIQERLNTMQEQRSKLYGDKDPDKEEKRLSEALQTFEREKKTTQDEQELLSRKILLLGDQLHRLKDALKHKENRYLEEANRFEKEMREKGFTTLEDYLQAQLPVEEIKNQERILREFDEKNTRNATLLREKKLQYENEAQLNPTAADQKSIEKILTKLQSQINDRNQIIGRLLSKKEENRNRESVQQQKLETLKKQEKELNRWQKLNSLIGSANGKKFRNFAQGITFEVMVAHANTSLKKMSDRYILVRDSTYPLELNVIDNYRAGDVRSTKNLSGGECFLVSLALALGLSNMAGKNIRVDSLFLDEGFGTLDEESLETALQSLAGLRHDGKTIGIISHVSLLKERLTTQIQVIPALGGHSSLRGPGIKQLS